jgi:hypothetical protein
VDVYGHSHGGIVAFGAATLTANTRKLALYEGWPVPDPSIYALPADVVGRMDKLLADGVAETLFRSIEDMSDDGMVALRSAPSRLSATHSLGKQHDGMILTRHTLDQIEVQGRGSPNRSGSLCRTATNPTRQLHRILREGCVRRH